MSTAVASLGVNGVKQQQLSTTTTTTTIVSSSAGSSAVNNKCGESEESEPMETNRGITSAQKTGETTSPQKTETSQDEHDAAAAAAAVPKEDKPCVEGQGETVLSSYQRQLGDQPAAAQAEKPVESTEATAIEDEDEPELPLSTALPAPLHRILFEVAKTGESSTLTWNSARKDGRTESGMSFSKKRSLSGGGNNTIAPSSATVAPIAMRPRGIASLQNVMQGNNCAAAKASPGGSPRKKHRNGLHNSTSGHRKTRQNHHRKRPLHLIRANNGGTGTATETITATTTATAVSAPGANVLVAAAAAAAAKSTSGSEPEDTSQYDSESTTSTSELSYDQQHWQVRHHSQQLNLRAVNAFKNASNARAEGGAPLFSFSSLREAFRIAIGVVLEDWFHHKGGYKLSPAENKRHQGRSVSPKEIFAQRKERLLKRLETLDPGAESSGNDLLGGPPFTIQRIAEVLVAPEKYYTQTHKLCNCLEKLLLVSSPITAFGGSRGGVNSQSQREEQELLALADERERIQSEFRQMRRRRSVATGSAEQSIYAEMGHGADVTDGAMGMHSIHKGEFGVGENGIDVEVAAANALSPAEAERLEAAARASLRNKFDHTGIDHHHHHHGAVTNPNVKAIAESRSLTNSPPPPSLASAPNLSGGLLRSPHATTHGEHPTSPIRSPSPILFGDVASSATSPHGLHNPNANMHLLQMHHAAAVAGVSPFDLMGLGSAAGQNTGPSVGGGLLGSAAFNGMKEMDVESRSSASSDVDSESDDVSFDDSASDRSDGSDSGFVGTAAIEGAGASNLSAVARAMALKRHQTRATQQQQRAQKMPATENNSGNGVGQESTGGGPTTTAGTDEAVPEDSDISDSSLSDMAD